MDLFKKGGFNAGDAFCDAFMLPKDAIAGATLFHLIGNRNLIIENFKCILSYTDCEIQIKGADNRYKITGEKLVIEYYTSDDMKIKGRINQVSVIDGV